MCLYDKLQSAIPIEFLVELEFVHNLEDHHGLRSMNSIIMINHSYSPTDNLKGLFNGRWLFSIEE